MGASNYDVAIIGGGCAGLSAAIGLAKAGFSAVVLEAAPFPGAENWSGCVYFCENLANPALLGPDVEELAWERRLVERGIFACNGHSLLGMTYRDPAAFRHCYTVLRPIFDHYMAQLAMQAGVVILNNTTAESLIRVSEKSDGNSTSRIVGVATNRGPVYAGLTFLAEGDASHLVTREGYERISETHKEPRFLHGIKQVIDLPPGAVEENFGLQEEQGAAYEILLRNGTLRGQTARLNMGGFVYTNRQSLSIGLVLPAENLHNHFGGDPNLLIEWFENLPDVRRWCKGGTRGVFGAKLIRGGGARDIPHLIDDGLAIGGAASAVGIDFPYPNFTGPATRMGLQIVEAVKAIRAAGGSFRKDELNQHYLEPLRKTHYWRDVEFLRRWPGYVERTHFFFSRNIDLILGTAYIWTRPRKWLLTKWLHWVRMLMPAAGTGHWADTVNDLRALARALRIDEVVARPHLGRLFLDGWMNAIRDLIGKKRKHVPPAGAIRITYSVAGGNQIPGRPPKAIRRWFRRFSPVLAAAAQRVYANDDTPLREKLSAATGLLIQQLNILDLFLAFVASLLAGATAVGVTMMTPLSRFRRVLGPLARRKATAPQGIYAEFQKAAHQSLDLTPLVAAAAQKWEERLSSLRYLSDKRSHIRILWPGHLEHKEEVTKAGLWHVCPAHVYEARVSPQNQLQLVVNFENCIKCETCWRTSDLVDWGRDGRQRFIYPVSTAAVEPLLAILPDAGAARPAPPKALDWWAGNGALTTESLSSVPVPNPERADTNVSLLRKLNRKLEQLNEALTAEPRTADRARAEQLERLSRYAQQLAEDLVQRLREEQPPVQARVLDLGSALMAKLGEMGQRVAQRKFSWAAADARQIRQHHLVGMGRLLGTGPAFFQAPDSAPETAWLHAEQERETLTHWQQRLDEAFPPHSWRDLERTRTLTALQEQAFRALVAAVPVVDPSNLRQTLHPVLRKAILAELGRRDPSLAYRAACHLWARDLTTLVAATSPWKSRLDRWTRGEKWAAFAVVANGHITDDLVHGEATFVPAADDTLLLIDNHLVLLPTGKAGRRPGVEQQPIETLGLRGADLQRLIIDHMALPEAHAAIDRDRLLRVWHVLSAVDLTSIAFGMADRLTQRCLVHALSRVQFPGLFHDERARDTIGKFGAVKQMVAEMAVRRWLIETLDRNLTPVDFSKATADRWSVLKGLVADALGTAPGSLAYNAGQIFGGTGFSEDDIFSKYYRDASAWRFLGQPNSEIWRTHGRRLLHEWHADGRGLARLDHEAELFDQVVQRKALQAELDELRVMRTRLRTLVGGWLWEEDSARPQHGSSSYRGQEAFLTEMLARQDVQLLASKALLLRTHARMEHGMDAEADLTLLRVWLGTAKSSLATFTAGLTALKERDADNLGVAPDGPVCRDYDQVLRSDAPYESGDFLRFALNPFSPRLLPDMVRSDPHLADIDRRFQTLLANHFGDSDRDGLPYEYYVERRHRPDEADLDFCRANGFFRMTIPEALGGKGLRKVDYYLLVRQAHRLADVSISLTIQVNTSLGTTPIFVARDKDLPKARKDLAPFIGDLSLQNEIRDYLQKLLNSLDRHEPALVQTSLSELNGRLEAAVFSRPVLKSLTCAFAEAWSRVKQAARDFDFLNCRAFLAETIEAWREACARAPELLEELARRQGACELALRWIAAGQISAFALTEPSAGSDTARLTTRAKLRSVPVQKDPDGVLRFVPVSGKEPRYLIDARRLEFRADGVFYRWSEAADAVPISFEAYDYETDDPGKTRSYDHGGRRIDFTDIAQVRERDGALWYDYWELNGAKMWITNGRMMGIMVLYAKTAEGVTAFVVDRHAEGLIIGKDEEKMGQRGSPTNELGLQNVRVPRENVLGLEGRGQVNALETLNIGRAGIALSATSLMESLTDSCRQFMISDFRFQISDLKGSSLAGKANSSNLKSEILNLKSPWLQWRLERMEEQRFIAEALAFEVIGRFDHKQTKTVRMESAIAKMLCTELWHSNIELAEEIHGLEGQTQKHRVEKRKRDARVLNIYEGTNEIQRFLILRELADFALPSSTKEAGGASDSAAVYRRRFQHLLDDFHRLLRIARTAFDADLGLNPNFQAGGFLLAEAAAWLKAIESVAARIVWLMADKTRSVADAEATEAVIEAGRRAFDRCAGEVSGRLVRFEQTLANWQQGRYAPEIHAADVLFNQASLESSSSAPTVVAASVVQPLSILVILEIEPGVGPRPFVHEGRLLEPYFTLTEASRAALEAALMLRDRSTQVRVKAALVASKVALPLLREVVALDVEGALLILSNGDWTYPEQAGEALASVLKCRREHYDLILSPGGKTSSQEGLVGQVASQFLEVPFAGSCHGLRLDWTQTSNVLELFDDDRRRRGLQSLPAAVAVQAGPGTPPLRAFTTEGYFRGLSKPIELELWPSDVKEDAVHWLSAARAAEADRATSAVESMTPIAAAQWLLGEMGIEAGDGDARAASFDISIEDVESPSVLEGNVALAIVACDSEGKLSTAAQAAVRAVVGLANAAEGSAAVLLLAACAPSAQQRALTSLAEFHPDAIGILAHEHAGPDLRSKLLGACWPSLISPPQLVLGESWAETALAKRKAAAESDGALALRARRLDVAGLTCRLEMTGSSGTLSTARILTLTPGDCHWVGCSEEFEFMGTWPLPAAIGSPAPRIQRWRPSIRALEMQSLVEELKAETGLTRLADAEFIIDVGFGVGNRDGYEEVIEPLEKVLRQLGVRSLIVGGSRKVTEELHLIPVDRQIGQSGQSVNPRILLAVGISGAPQHLDYIAERTTIVAFNRDAEAPIMTLNQRRSRPRVLPVVGDLFETVPALARALSASEARDGLAAFPGEAGSDGLIASPSSADTIIASS